MQKKPIEFIEDDQTIDLKKWIVRIVSNWYLFLVFLALGLFIALFINKFSEKKYRVSAKILIRDEIDPLAKSQVFRVALYSDPYRLENEVGILRSKLVLNQTVKEIGVYTEYYVQEKFGNKEIYKNAPFTILFDSLSVQPVNVEFNLQFLNDTTIFIYAVGQDVQLYDYQQHKVISVLEEFLYTDTLRIGEIVENSYCKFLILPNFAHLTPSALEKDYIIVFRSLKYLRGLYHGIDVEVSKGSSILNISKVYPNVNRSVDLINKLIEVYLEKGVERNNRVATNTISFIDAQLEDIVDSLQLSEQDLEDFRSEHQALDIDYQAQQAYSRIDQLQGDKARTLVKLRYLNYLSKSITSSQQLSDLVAPSTMDITDPVLDNLVMELMELYSEMTELSLNSRRDNPYITSLQQKIETTQQHLLETVENIREATEINLENIEKRLADTEGRLFKLPKDQRELLRMERRFSLNDEIYTYLLERRSEMQIKKASNIPYNEVLEYAAAEDAVLVYPKSKTNYFIAIIIGLIVPILLLYLGDVVNDRIQHKDEIKNLTDIPVLGTILMNKEKDFLVFRKPQSPIAESFRSLYANLQFVLIDSAPVVIMVTSAIKGEGKSFVSINMASVFAAYDRKVCLVDLDLRKSKIATYLNVEQKTGISLYLSNRCELKELSMHHEELNFDYICAGPVPPNPSELLASSRTNTFLNYLRSEYDVIIIDTPPIGVVSDTITLSKVADHIVLTVRHNVTPRKVLEAVFEEFERRDLKHLNIVYNGIPIVRGGYGYGYNYGYSYDYFEKGKKIRWPFRKGQV